MLVLADVEKQSFFTTALVSEKNEHKNVKKAEFNERKFH